MTTAPRTKVFWFYGYDFFSPTVEEKTHFLCSAPHMDG